MKSIQVRPAAAVETEASVSEVSFDAHTAALNLNADYNGAKNILKRALGKLYAEPLSSVGAGLTQPRTPQG